jgi:hypothetical protein
MLGSYGEAAMWAKRPWQLTLRQRQRIRSEALARSQTHLAGGGREHWLFPHHCHRTEGIANALRH